MGYLIGAPHNKDYSMLGSILGSLYFGELLYTYICTDREVCFMHIYIYIYVYL